MSKLQGKVRRGIWWIHLCLGLAASVLVVVMGLSGALLLFRPELTALLSPAPKLVAACETPINWDQAETGVRNFASAEAGRIYFPRAGTLDPRYHFQMQKGEGRRETVHVIYDACAGQVLGYAQLGWIDWLVDLHHNLLLPRNGKQWVGVIGISLLLLATLGAALWLLANPRLSQVLRPNLRQSALRTSFDLHRTFGLIAGLVLTLQAFTSLWLSYPQTMRAALSAIADTGQDARPMRDKKKRAEVTRAPLRALIESAQAEIPDGQIRQIRLAEGGRGTVQVRMSRPGDFSSAGNNTVILDAATARAVTLDRYGERSGASRFTQAMTALHYGEWGGTGFRAVSAVAGASTALLAITGILVWWLPLRRRARRVPATGVLPQTVSSEAILP